MENKEMLSVAPLLYLTLSPDQDYLQSNWFEQLEINSEPVTTEAEGIVENEWIVQLNQESLKKLYSVSKAADYFDDYGVTVIGGLGSPGTLLIRMDASSSELQNEILSGITYLDSWEPNAVFTSTGVAGVVNDPLVKQQWYLDTINVLPAWEQTKGEGVVVAVIDSGIQLDHPDLQANIWTNPNEIAGNGIDDDDNGFIDDIHGWNTEQNNNIVQDTTGHGTKVSGIIGAVDNNIGVVGIAPNVQILPVKTNSNGYHKSSMDIAAINYIIKLKVENNINIRVINASFGFTGGVFSS
ncbi:MAG: S8 family serine peptidase, partial [Planctomycetaceae bacterium]|nr:S8 family serine peptidase [Planctomycetaceae bacterium]